MKIQKNIPIPGAERGNQSILTKMEVGDSILAPNEKAPTLKAYASLLKKRKGLQFVTRSQPTESGVRFWRVK